MMTSYTTKIEIANPMGAVEDAAGALTTAKTVLSVAIASVEDVTSGLELETMPNDAMLAKVKEAWGLMTQVEAAMTASLAIIYAAVDHRDPQPQDSNGGSTGK